MCCTRLAGKYRTQKWRKNRHLGTIAQLCRAVSSQLKHVSRTGKRLLKSNISCTCLHNMANFGPLAAEMGSGVWGTPANFKRVSRLAFVTARCSPEANQTLRDVWLSPGLVHYIYIFGGSWPDRIWPGANSLFAQVLRWPISVTSLHGTPAADVSQTLQRRIQGMELRNFRRGHHLCSAGRPSRWASAHILVVIIITVVVFGVAVVVAAVVVVVVGDVNSGSSSGDISNNTHLYSCTINGST